MEILSPASNMNHIQVAIDEKAGAVYGGVKKWNARNKAINFTTEEYNNLLDELHKNNIRFYLTLNVLMLDSEIDEVINFLKTNKLPDAFIVTDIGLISVLKKEFPNVPLHFSTQFGTHNIDDVNYIKSLGGERAILARELTLNEINKIKDKSQIELECFIWGSQCLSFSGLCFFGTLINGGGGNRGKCIITCRDVYSVNDQKGHYLYVPDMDCINLISKLDNIECLKLEGRRRNPNEIKEILQQIRKKESSKDNVGYLYGKSLKENHLFENINNRIKPVMCANELLDITDDDVCIRYKDGKPLEFSKDYYNPDVMYVYTEIKKPYLVNKMNISLDFSIKNNTILEILYINHKGTGNTFFCKAKELIKLDFKKLKKDVEINTDINIYKIKYKRGIKKDIYINKSDYNNLVNYILKDCIKKTSDYSGNIAIKNLYVETDSEDIAKELAEDKDIKVIYNIKTVRNLKNIKNLVNDLKDNVIYKLPLFNWNSDNLYPYYQELEGKEIMFTRLSQIDLCKDLNFKKKYVDYTIYIWNKKTKEYLKKYQIEEFTASVELSYETSKNIFENDRFQVIVGGKLPLVFTRNCFGNIYGCGCNKSCLNTKTKDIFNEDKSLEFEISCNEDYRCIYYKYPFLNDYSKVPVTDNTKYRYVVYNEDINEIRENIKALKSSDYYNKLFKNNYWRDSYECNLLDGKD